MRLVVPLVLVLALAGCDQHSHDHAPPAPPTAPRPKGPLDPICGMKGDPATAKFKSTHDGKEVGFCSETCKVTFDRDPAKYAMGWCPCSKTRADCGCGHCKGGAAPKEACNCGDEKPGEHKH